MKEARERELKLAAPASFRLPSFANLPDGVFAKVREPLRLLATYHDTSDLRLLRFGVTLRHRTGEGWTLKLPEDVDGAFVTRRELTFPGSPRKVPAEALDLVRAYARSSELEPQARLRTVRRAVDLVGADGVPLGQICDDEVAILDGARVTDRFREVEVEAAEEMPPQLVDRVVSLLEEAGIGEVDPTPKVVRALGAPAQEPPDVVAGKLPRDASAGEVVRRAIAASLIRLLRHDVVVRLDSHPEGVHKARVATRTIRSDLRTFGPLVDPVWARGLRDELWWLAGLLGRVRDADVLLMRLRGRVDELRDPAAKSTPQVLATLERQRALAQEKLLEALGSERYVELLDRLVAAAHAPVLTEQAARPAADVVPDLLKGPWRSLRKSVTALSKLPSAEELHDVRIKAKRCRYAAEAVAPVAGKRAAAFAARAAALQDALGEHNDAVVAEAWLQGWASLRRTPSVVFAAGELAGLEHAAALRARRRWRPAWKKLVASAPRAWS
jgi:CHAD domain-containing protein